VCDGVLSGKTGGEKRSGRAGSSSQKLGRNKGPGRKGKSEANSAVTMSREDERGERDTDGLANSTAAPRKGKARKNNRKLRKAGTGEVFSQLG